VNITTSASSPNGTFGGVIKVNRTSDGYIENITVNFTISSAGAGDVKIVNNTFSISGTVGTSYMRTFQINNTGSYKLTNCNASVITTIPNSVSWSKSNFDILVATPTLINMSFTGNSVGADSSAILKIECVASQEGGIDIR